MNAIFWTGRCFAGFLGTIATCWCVEAQQPEISPANPEWPRTFIRDGATNIIYQPQLESWDNNLIIKGRSAVSVQPTGAQQPIYGTIEISAETEVDKVQRLVYFDKFQITNAQFPSDPENQQKHLETFRSFLPKEVKTMSLDRAEASLALLEQKRKGRGEPIRNDCPQLIFTEEPAMLIQLEGDPVYKPVEGTGLERVVNTRTLLLRDKGTGKHYLHFFDGYVEATNLAGPWQVARSIPSGASEAEKKAVESKEVDLLAGQENPETKAKPSLKTTRVPRLFVVTIPSELIVTQGAPQWAPIPNTQLLFATNTASHLFKNIADQKTYILISGRWFRASALSGPWEHVAGSKLPGDFAAIPDDSEKENVKAAVPNTRQAQEAAIANDIPQTTRVSRKEQQLDPPPVYDGEPQLQPIEGTGLQFVKNSTTPVIKVKDDLWYACQNAVWFVASSPQGPWSVADNVAPEIYSIPPSSPVHYVTYVRVYNADPEYVWVGATPGYFGTVTDSEGVVVYGTGYTYPAYVGSTVYVSYPVTYGYASNPTWTPWVGWAFGFAAAWAIADNWDDRYWGYCPPAPYWGAYRYGCYGRYYNPYGGITAWGPYGWAGTSGYVYHQAGNRAGISRSAAGFNPWTGNEWARQYGRSYNSVTGVRTAGSRGSVNNIYTGRYAEGGRGVAVHDPSGAVAAGRRGTVGGPGGEISGGRGVAYNPQTGQGAAIRGVRGDEGGVARINGQVVAAKDGNVYRGNSNGGWNNVSVTPHARTTSYRSSAPSQAASSYNNQVAAARNTGAQRQASFQQHQPSFNRSAAPRGGGGGFRGGGGGGRRR